MNYNLNFQSNGLVLFLIFISDIFIAVSGQTKRSCCITCDNNFVPPSEAAEDPVLFAFADDSTLECSGIKDSSLIEKLCILFYKEPLLGSMQIAML